MESAEFILLGLFQTSIQSISQTTPANSPSSATCRQGSLCFGNQLLISQRRQPARTMRGEGRLAASWRLASSQIVRMRRRDLSHWCKLLGKDAKCPPPSSASAAESMGRRARCRSAAASCTRANLEQTVRLLQRPPYISARLRRLRGGPGSPPQLPSTSSPQKGRGGSCKATAESKQAARWRNGREVSVGAQIILSLIWRPGYRSLQYG